ncbi:hypothetical protein GC173_15850 [bacterium]|nr:hypothetical protein [bacterium]
MSVSLVPLVALVLLNFAVVAWMVRLGDRTRSGFFLMLNCLGLILWAAGQFMHQALQLEAGLTMALPYLATLLIPANFLHHAMTRPRPLVPIWGRPSMIFAVFAPAVVLPLLGNYHESLSEFLFVTMRTEIPRLDSTATRAAVLYALGCILGAVAALAVRYNGSTGPDQNLSKHLIGCIVGPFLFAGVIWASSGSGQALILPSPGFLFAIMAQGAVVVVLRQEELRAPHIFQRVVYVLAAIIVSFVLVALLSELYSLLIGSVLVDRTIGWLLVAIMLCLLLGARLAHIDRLLDKILFTRAAEYRRVVEETRRELADTRERLRRTERLSVVGELAARVGHEIKNPLGPIKGYAQIMRDKLEQCDDFIHRDAFLRHLSVIFEEVENIDRRVRELLDSARIPQLAIAPIDVNRLVERCATILGMEAATHAELDDDRRPTRIDVDLHREVDAITGDEARLEEALFNLGRNALESMNDNPGRIVLETRPAQFPNGQPAVRIAVEDNGPGIDEEMASHLFEAFYTRKQGGTGLGLAIVKSIVEAHGGEIAMKPGADQKGTRFEILLPLEATVNPGAMLPKGGGHATPTPRNSSSGAFPRERIL